MTKKFLCLFAAVLLLFTTEGNVCAEELKSSRSWNVEFDGSKMNSNFKSSEMTEEIYQILPGDTIRLKIGIKNAGDGDTNWYMTNEVLKTLEDTQSVAEGGAYTYILTYVNGAGQETVLYSSEVVGGEGETKAGVGLNQATDALGEWFFLDGLSPGEKGTVYLTVGLDGETQGNAYQDTLARLKMNFAVEEHASISERDRERHMATPASPSGPLGRNIPKTGDETDLLFWCASALVCGVMFLILGLLLLKQKKEDGEEEAG